MIPIKICDLLGITFFVSSTPFEDKRVLEPHTRMGFLWYFELYVLNQMNQGGVDLAIVPADKY